MEPKELATKLNNLPPPLERNKHGWKLNNQPTIKDHYQYMGNNAWLKKTTITWPGIRVRSKIKIYQLSQED